MFKPTDYDTVVINKQWEAILLSPQGRDLGRWIATEVGNGSVGDVVGVKAFIHDALETRLNKLYGGPAPTVMASDKTA